MAQQSVRRWHYDYYHCLEWRSECRDVPAWCKDVSLVHDHLHPWSAGRWRSCRGALSWSWLCGSDPGHVGPARTHCHRVQHRFRATHGIAPGCLAAGVPDRRVPTVPCYIVAPGPSTIHHSFGACAMKLIDRITIIVCFFGALALMITLAIMTNLTGFRAFLSELHTGFDTFVAEVWVGIKLLAGTAFMLGLIAAIIKLNHLRKVHVVRPGKTGPAQALVRSDGSVEHLGTAYAQMDPAQQLLLLEKILKVAAQSATTTHRLSKYLEIEAQPSLMNETLEIQHREAPTHRL